MSNARQHDQFYTRKDLALRLTECVRANCAPKEDEFQWLEPSAGSGSFLDAMPAGAHGLDLEPRHPGVKEGNFLFWAPCEEDRRPWMVVGNPPFGKNASQAIKFFNHAASFAHTIAFIVPRTFEKSSVQKRLNRQFHLKLQEVLPLDSFEFEGQPYSVPCVFQIWERGHSEREHVQLPLTHLDFEYTTRARGDFAFQRVGVKAGAVKALPNENLAAPSHHFIRVCDRSQIEAVRDRLKNLDWEAVKHRTAGNPSISKAEMVALYAQEMERLSAKTASSPPAFASERAAA